MLFIFPNVFEFFFIYQVITMKWFPHLQVNDYRRLALVIPILLVLKLLQNTLFTLLNSTYCARSTCTLRFSTTPMDNTWGGVSEFIDEYFTLWC